MNMPAPERIIHVFVRGRVQGVGYRDWTERQASTRGLKGWVRNRADGSVEAVFAGAADNVSAMAEALKRGPMLAKVTAVEMEETGVEALEAASGTQFVRRPTV